MPKKNKFAPLVLYTILITLSGLYLSSCSDLGGTNCLDCYSTRTANNTEALVKMQLSSTASTSARYANLLTGMPQVNLNEKTEILSFYAQAVLKQATLKKYTWDNATREKHCKVAITSSTNLTEYDATCRSTLLTQIKSDLEKANVLIQERTTPEFTAACLGSSPTKTPAECKTLARAQGIGFSFFYNSYSQSTAELKSAQLFKCAPNPVTIVERLQASSSDGNAFLSILIEEAKKCSLTELAEICFTGPAEYSPARAYNNIYPGDLFQTIGCAIFSVGSTYYGCEDVSSPADGKSSAQVLKSRFDGTGPNAGTAACNGSGLNENTTYQHLKIGLLWMCGAKAISSDGGVTASSYEYLEGSFASSTSAVSAACDDLLDTLNSNVPSEDSASLAGIMTKLLN